MASFLGEKIEFEFLVTKSIVKTGGLDRRISEERRLERVEYEYLKRFQKRVSEDLIYDGRYFAWGFSEMMIEVISYSGS